jgi:hypothetical protein
MSMPFARVLRRFRAPGTVLQILAVLLFIGAGVLAAPLLGFEDDELIFVNLFTHPDECFSRIPLGGGHAIPIMAMSYLGAVKAWVYSPLLALANPTIWVVRLPALLLAAMTIVLTGRLLMMIQDRSAALIAVCLLASDATFLFTAVFDWGPVVLQHLLLVIMLLLMMRWYRTQIKKFLFWGAFTIGIALWDKSLFLWQLAGMTAGLLTVAFPLLRRIWQRPNIAIFARGLLLGALPLIGANFRHHFATLKDNGHMTLSGFSMKARFMRSALDGREATTFFLDGGNNSVDLIRRPLESFALGLADSLGRTPSMWRFYPGLIVIGLAIFLTRGAERRWILFFLIAGSVSWLQSAITLHAGDVIHHAVLFWVQWYCAVSLSLAALFRSQRGYVRVAMALAVTLACFRGFQVIGANYGNLIAHPAGPRWLNADHALAQRLLRAGIKRVVVADWGMKNVVRAASNNRIAVNDQSVPLNYYGTFDKAAFGGCAPADCAVVRRAPGKNVFPQAPATLDRALPANGFTVAGRTLVYDTHGVPAFEFFRLERSAGRSGTVNRVDDRVDIVHTPGPDTAACVDQRGPKPGIVRKGRVGGEIFAGGTRGEAALPFLAIEQFSVFSHEIHTTFQPDTVNQYFDDIAIAQLAERAARQRFRRNVANASAG